VDSLTFNSVIPALFSSIPEARAAYDAWDMPGDPLPYIVFSFLEESFLTPAVNAGDSELLRRIFELLERMALSPSEEVVTLLWVGLFEPWAANPTTLKKALEHMGPATRALACEAAYRLTGRNPPPWGLTSIE
jgi:hypothetical protein